jgi:protein SCO1/2
MRRSALIIASAGGVLAASVAFGSRAIAHPDTTSAPDEYTPPPPTYKANDVLVQEHLGASVPLDARFRTSDGRHVTLGQVIDGELPTILTFNYSDCPMLCSLQLNGLATALPKIAVRGDNGDVPLAAGQQFRIVTIDLEPTESLAKIQKMRERYITQLPAELQSKARDGWTFLVAENPGDGVQIRRVADSVGFQYRYIPERAEWAHPAALIFLASTGMVTRYVYGIEYAPAIMRESIFKAGTSQGAASVGFMNRCYHYDPDANSHARVGVLALRIGAASFLVLFVSAFGLMRFVRKHGHRGAMEKSS